MLQYEACTIQLLWQSSKTPGRARNGLTPMGSIALALQGHSRGRGQALLRLGLPGGCGCDRDLCLGIKALAERPSHLRGSWSLARHFPTNLVPSHGYVDISSE